MARGFCSSYWLMKISYAVTAQRLSTLFLLLTKSGKKFKQNWFCQLLVNWVTTCWESYLPYDYDFLQIWSKNLNPPESYRSVKKLCILWLQLYKISLCTKNCNIFENKTILNGYVVYCVDIFLFSALSCLIHFNSFLKLELMI